MGSASWARQKMPVPGINENVVRRTDWKCSTQAQESRWSILLAAQKLFWRAVGSIGKNICHSKCGRDWIEAFGIIILKPLDVKTISIVEGLVGQFSDVFSDNLGTMKGVLATISLRDEARPKFFKARPVLFGLVDRYVEELQWL
ncbi:hypothetical protein MRX96_003503 [Rhipicephalus microplus]